MDHSIWDSQEASTVAAIRNGIRIRGRTFTPEELAKIRRLVETSPGDHRFALSKRVCEELGWVQHNGRLKDRSCRDVLARLEQMGWAAAAAVAASALLRGSYHLYQGWGGFAGNLALGVFFGIVFVRYRRTWTLVVAHVLVDALAGLGYLAFRSHLPGS